MERQVDSKGGLIIPDGVHPLSDCESLAEICILITWGLSGRVVGFADTIPVLSKLALQHGDEVFTV